MDSSTERSDGRLLAGLAALVSVVALVWNFRHGLILLPNDAIAHINDARRIFDSQTPGLRQLGTVWLPLPQLLQAPFLLSDTLWRTGIGGCIPSMVAYGAGVLGIFRLVRGQSSRTVAWMAALIYALNPNLVYMQATPMAEAIYLALFIWAVVYFDEFRRIAATDPAAGRRLLLRCALVLSASMLVRYDGWFLAACVFAGVLLVVWRDNLRGRELRSGLLQFAALIALTAGAWLAYNHFVYGNSLDFVTGLYSVRGITERTTMAAYPGRGDLRTSAIFFLRSATLNTGVVWGHVSLLNLAFVALIAAAYFSRRHLAGLLLWVPVVFYVINIAWNSVIIFLPEWWPFSYYNVRYGLQLLPAIAVFVVLGCGFLMKLAPARYCMAAVVLIVLISYGLVLRDGPICLGEAQANGAPRQALDIHVARALLPLSLSPDATFMIDLRMRSGVALQAGIHFKRILHPGMYQAWKQGIANPSAAADYVIAVTGDEVDQAVRAHPQGLELIATVDTPGQARAFVYRTMR